MSLTYKGIAVSVIAWLFAKYNVPFLDNDIGQAIEVIVALIGVIITAYGRYRIGGISALGVRK